MENYQQEVLMWGILSLLGGSSAAVALYYGVRRWPATMRWVLAGLRAIAFGGLLFLLFAPILEQSSWKKEPPVFIVAWDNSQSMGCCLDSAVLVTQLERLKSGLKKWSEEKEINLRVALSRPEPPPARLSLLCTAVQPR